MGIAIPPTAGIHNPPPLVVGGACSWPRRRSTATKTSTSTTPKITADATSMTHQRRAISSDALLFGERVDWSFSAQPATMGARRRKAPIVADARRPLPRPRRRDTRVLSPNQFVVRARFPRTRRWQTSC